MPGGVDEPVGLSGVADIFLSTWPSREPPGSGPTIFEAEMALIPEIDATYTQWIRERS